MKIQQRYKLKLNQQPNCQLSAQRIVFELRYPVATKKRQRTICSDKGTSTFIYRSMTFHFLKAKGSDFNGHFLLLKLLLLIIVTKRFKKIPCPWEDENYNLWFLIWEKLGKIKGVCGKEGWSKVPCLQQYKVGGNIFISTLYVKYFIW